MRFEVLAAALVFFRGFSLPASMDLRFSDNRLLLTGADGPELATRFFGWCATLMVNKLPILFARKLLEASYGPKCKEYNSCVVEHNGYERS